MASVDQTASKLNLVKATVNTTNSSINISMSTDFATECGGPEVINQVEITQQYISLKCTGVFIFNRSDLSLVASVSVLPGESITTIVKNN
jgi:hypothetical protein